MTKYLLFLVAAAGLIFSNSGCTSKKADVNEQVVENADVEKIEADGLGAVEQDIDSSLEAAMGESGTAPSATPPSEVASAAPTLDETSLNTTAATTPADVAATATTTEPAITETPTAPVEATTVDTSPTAVASDVIAPTETSTETSAAEAAKSDVKAATSTENLPKSSGSVLKKIAATAPYQGKDGGWINTVYIARPKEKLDEISLKIYGTDKSNDLKNITENSYLKSRAVRAGDKIYYVSPNRPDDSSKTMIYYEDMGMIPETYVAKKGENLRKVSKKLLGYDNAWKEVWTSNSIESKTSLKDGETFRYWKMADIAATAAVPAAPPTSGATLIDAAQAPEVTAQTTPPTAATATESSLPPPPADANANLPPPPADVAATSAPATADSATAAPTATEPGLPPPPTEELAAPPPPPPPEAVAEAAPRKKVNLDEAATEEEEEAEGLDSDTMMSMAALGVLVALMAFVIIRKKKQKAEQMASEMNA